MPRALSWLRHKGGRHYVSQANKLYENCWSHTGDIAFEAWGSMVEEAFRAAAEATMNVIVAIPVAPPDTVRKLEKITNRVLCLRQPSDFRAIGQFYRDFAQVDDEEAKRLLQEENTWKKKGKNLVRSEVSTNALLDLNQDTPWTLLQLVNFCSKNKVAFR